MVKALSKNIFQVAALDFNFFFFNLFDENTFQLIKSFSVHFQLFE